MRERIKANRNYITSSDVDPGEDLQLDQAAALLALGVLRAKEETARTAEIMRRPQRLVRWAFRRDNLSFDGPSTICVSILKASKTSA
jgi:hypothetical protein